MYLLGVDPGKMTGIVVTCLTNAGLELVHHEQYTGFTNTVGYVMGKYADAYYADYPELPTMVVESYTSFNTPFHADANWAVQIIGALRWELYKEYEKTPVMQRPQERLFITDNMLRKLGFWIKGQEHSRQAMKHVLTYCIRVLHHPALMCELRDVTESA